MCFVQQTNQIARVSACCSPVFACFLLARRFYFKDIRKPLNGNLKIHARPAVIGSESLLLSSLVCALDIASVFV